MPDYQHIRELAQNATPGPWETTPDADGAVLIIEIEDDIRDDYHGIYATGDVAPGKEDAAFIAAANPTVVLDLLTTIDTLVTQVRNQATDIEDTRAAYQLAQRQLDAHRRGQGTYEGITR